ncbi:MAG: sensor histidine kinase [Pleurocapsa sp.]
MTLLSPPQASSRFLPEVINSDSELMERWENLTEEEVQEVFIPDPDIGSIIYEAIPIKTSDETLGVFVIAHATAGERQEAVEAMNVVIEVLIFILAITLLLAWFAAGRILAPLKQLSNTVKSISESDLTRRINIQGEGELAQLGNTFNEMMDRLESAFATQSNFMNDAGHELKTPITIIRGHLELIDDALPEQQETIDLVIDELDRMNRLVEDLILLTKAERPDFLQIDTIDLAAFIPELFNKISALGERNWHLENDLSAVKMIGDRQRITQAIINLANNAVQHTTTNSLIVLGAKLERDRVALSIRDTGEGIAHDEQQRIFERFARVKNIPRRSEGSGLGLAIVKAIVEAHEGWIHLQSQLGVGSTFTLIFPLEFKQNLILEKKR